MIYEIIGWVSTISILFAYFLVSNRKLLPTSKEYQFLNLVGAIGIIINSVVHRAIPYVGLNSVWLLIAVYGLVKAFKK